MAFSWMTAFLDLAEDGFDEALAYWQCVTGYSASPPSGERDEFVVLRPPAGDAFLRVQRTADGSNGVHVDLHAPDQPFEVRRSPGGLDYCLVPGRESERPAAAVWDDGTSLVDQVCIDVPPDLWEAECGFWAGVTGWELTDNDRPEFRRLVKPAGQPVNLLLQRLDDGGAGRVTAHLDLSSTNRDAEAQRHIDLGGRVVSRMASWTVLRDPVGTSYCITDRRPYAEETS